MGSTSSALGGAPAPRDPSDLSFDIAFPAGFGINSVAVAARDDLVLGHHTTILSTNGAPGTVTSVGFDGVSVGGHANLGAVVSRGDIDVDSSWSTIGFAESAGHVEVDPGNAVAKIIEHGTVSPFAKRTIDVSEPLSPKVSFFAAAHSTAVLPPGHYDHVVIESGAVVTLSTGTYFIDDFELSASSVLSLNTSTGGVSVFVKERAYWAGAVSGDATQFLFGYLGELPLPIAGPFSGTGLAPHARMEIGWQASPYHATFYGREVVVDPGVTVQELATPILINGITVSNKTPCVGEPVEVTLDGTYNAATATPWIQGTVGTHQFVQFGTPGSTKLIYASVVDTNGNADWITVPVAVQACAATPTAPPPLALHFWPEMRKGRNTVELMVHGYDSNGLEAPLTAPATYSWTFGDGQTATTTSPLVSHDYSGAVNPMDRYGFFNVAVSVSSASGTVTVPKVVSTWSLYAENRAHGIIQPPTAMSTTSASPLAVDVTNYESAPLSMSRAIVELLPCDPSQPARKLAPTTISATLPASSTTTVVVPPPDPFAPDVCAIAVHLIGTSASGSVYADAYVRLQDANPVRQHLVTDPVTITALNRASTLTADPGKFDEFELRPLYAQGVLTDPLAPEPMCTGPACGTTVQSECTPGDVNGDGTMICEATADWVINPPEVLNAYAGNFSMDHGCGTIGQLLGAVGQKFSHTETFVQDRVAVRHSTANTDRITDTSHLLYANLQLDPNVLQYAWPGTADHDVFSVDQITGGGYWMTDPNGQSWQFQGELSSDPQKCDSDTTAVPAIVIRPMPDAPPSATATMKQVAAQAVATTGYYNFYMYSHSDQAAIATSTPNYPEATWALGTEASVCSSFDRLAALATATAGLSLWPSRSLGQGVPDGMTIYPEPIRRTGANQLKAIVSNLVEDKCAAMAGGLFTNFDICNTLSDNVSNQFVNCFASGRCGDDGKTWHNPGAGVAVSPDDLLNWDPYSNNTAFHGAYGYKEPMVYVPKSYSHAGHWVPAPGTGPLTVNVVNADGGPLGGAAVLVDGLTMGLTDDAGTLQLDAVAAIQHDVQATYYTGTKVLPPPAPPALSTTQIEALPDCSAKPTAPICRIKPIWNGQSWTGCPSGWESSGASPCAETVATGKGVPIVHVIACACYEQPSPLSCDFWYGDELTTVLPTPGTDSVSIRLCEGTCIPTSNGGTPTYCPQSCKNDADCGGAGLRCDTSTGLCTPAQTSVTLTVSDVVWNPTVLNGCATTTQTGQLEYSAPGVSAADAGAGFTITCTPTFDAGAYSTTPVVVGGQVGCSGSNLKGAWVTLQCWGDGVVGDFDVQSTVSAWLTSGDDCGSSTWSALDHSLSQSTYDLIAGQSKASNFMLCATPPTTCASGLACPDGTFSAQFQIAAE